MFLPRSQLIPDELDGILPTVPALESNMDSEYEQEYNEIDSFDNKLCRNPRARMKGGHMEHLLQ